ncbi:MAG: LacI family DNA-binding transcriptional regulator [Propionibacteriaceae bacterium]|nr:LacI family DNA-binding transcriptional regulator [Propionibacteriaceae bacterium]
MADVAREAGVSRALVSIAYRGAVGVSEDTKRKIFDTGERLGYRPNRIASRLRSKASTTVGVFLLELRNDVFADMFDGIRELADRAEKDLVLSVGQIDGKRDAHALDGLARSRVDVVVAGGLLLPDDEVRTFSRSVPVVSAARLIPGVDSAGADNLLGAHTAVRHLLRLGHEHIAFLANPQTDGYLDRQRGYLELIAEAGLAANVIPSAYSRELATRDIGPALDSPQRPTAVFAHNDQAAMGVLDAARSRGIRVPEDLSVIGFDNTVASRAPGTDLTTVDIHGREIGRNAMGLALQRLEDLTAPAAQTISLPSLVVRRTTGPAPS